MENRLVVPRGLDWEEWGTRERYRWLWMNNRKDHCADGNVFNLLEKQVSIGDKMIQLHSRARTHTHTHKWNWGNINMFGELFYVNFLAKPSYCSFAKYYLWGKLGEVKESLCYFLLLHVNLHLSQYNFKSKKAKIFPWFLVLCFATNWKTAFKLQHNWKESKAWLVQQNFLLWWKEISYRHLHCSIQQSLTHGTI